VGKGRLGSGCDDRCDLDGDYLDLEVSWAYLSAQYDLLFIILMLSFFIFLIEIFYSYSDYIRNVHH
jgi:hypothetical protein